MPEIREHWRDHDSPDTGGEPEQARRPLVPGQPHPVLRSLLPRGYCGFTEETTPRHLALPATNSTSLVIKLSDSPYRPPQFLLGAHGSAMSLEGACSPRYLEILLAPLGAYTLLGRPVGDLGRQTIDLHDVFGHDGRRLGERLRTAPTWRRRFVLLDDFLLQRWESGPQVAPEVRSAWHLLESTSGAVRIGHLADEVGWSHKHLIARFKQQIGLTPKTAAALLRFDAVRLRLSSAATVDWAQLAADTGYADQAHLIRDFRRRAGRTPTDFLVRARIDQNRRFASTGMDLRTSST